MDRYFYDLEFEEDGTTIIPISFGMTSQDGRDLYLVNKKYMQSYIDLEGYEWRGHVSVLTNWLCVNVCDHIPQEDVNKFGVDYEDWGSIILDFISDGGRIKSRDDVELWAYFAAYDHVSLAQNWGPMINLPEPIPMYTRDLKAEIVRDRLIPFKPEIEHHALYDAKWNKRVWETHRGEHG